MTKDEKDFAGTPHFIAYLDILGYEQLVRECGIAGLSKIIYKRILASEGTAATAREVFAEGREEHLEDFKIKIKVFSDNFFFCTRKNWKGLITLILAFQTSMAYENILMRGALCHGDIYFGEEFICGDGLIRAHKLENEIAIFPRVIVDDSFLAKATPTEYLTGLELLKAAGNLKIDFDGYHFINYLSIPLMREKERDALLKSHRDFVAGGLENENIRVKQKYQWVKNYHNNFCEENGLPEEFWI
ncbi:MAG: hypothetical protein FWC93_02780 [Defluviitaleaceae bacterium]|nr:hypothetical protein [Defluviitaleaceae bacterium]